MASPFAASRRRRAQSDPIEDQVDMEFKNAAAMAEDNARVAESDRRRAMAARLAELNAELKARDKAEASTVRGPAGQVLRPESTAAKRVLTDDTTGEQFVQTSTGELEPAALNAPLFRRNGRLVRERAGMRPVDAGIDPATRDRQAVEENLRLADESAQIAQTALDQQESQAELAAQEAGLDASLAKTRAAAARNANEYQMGALPEETASLTAEERANAARKAAIDTKRHTMGGKAQYGAFENFLKRRKAAVSQIDVSDGRLPDDYLKQFGATKIQDQNTPDGWKERLGPAKKAEAGAGGAVPGSAQVVTPAENQAQQDLSEFEAYGQEIASLYDADDQTLQAKLQDLDGQIEQGNAFLTQGSADVESRAAQARTAFEALLLENQQAVQANPDAQHLTVTVGDRKELWTPELYRRREKLVADAKKMDGDMQAMQDELEAESGRLQQVVDMRNTAASVLNDRVTKAKTAQAEAVKAEADRLRATPHLAEYADDLEQIDRDVETRLAKVREMFPEGGEGARKAVLEEARVSRELLAKNIQDTDRAHKKKVGSAYAQVRESLPGVNFNFYGRESQDKEKAFSEYKDGGKALDEQVDTAIWKAAQDTGVPEAEVRKAFEREREYDWTGSPESETSRVLSTGKIAVKPELALDKKAYERAIADSDATPEQKAEAYRTMQSDRMKVAAAVAPLLAADEESTSEKVAKFVGALPLGPVTAALTAMDQGFTAWQKDHPSDKPQTEQILEYFDTQGAGSKFLRHMGEAIKGSLTSLSKSAAGAGAAVTDANWMHNLMTQAGQVEQLQGEYRQRTAVDANMPKALGFTPGEAYSTLLQSAPAIVGGSLNPAVAAILAGAQSGGGTYADAYEAYKTQGLEESEARRAARLPAALTGAATAFLTSMGGATGTESLSRVMQNTAQRNALHATIKGRLGAILKETGLGSLKGAAREAFFEEVPDQMIQGIVAKMTYQPGLTNAQYFEDAAKAAVGGFFMGGPFEALSTGTESSRRNRLAEQPATSSLEPEQWAAALESINTFQAPGMAPEDIERSQRAAEALLYIGRGQAADLPDAMLETVGVQRNAKGELENIKGRKFPQVKIENGNPIITDQSTAWLKQYMPGVASTLSMDEMGARQMFNQPEMKPETEETSKTVESAQTAPTQQVTADISGDNAGNETATEPVWSYTDPVGTTHILPKSAASSPVEAAQQFTATTGVEVQPVQVVRPVLTATPDDAKTATTSAKIRTAFRALADDAKAKGQKPAVAGAIKLAGSLTEKYARQYGSVFSNVRVSEDVPAAAAYQGGVLHINPTIMSGLVKANIRNAEAVVRSVIREEVVHHLIGQTVTTEQLGKLWTDLPPALRTASRNAYEAAQISKLRRDLGRDPSQAEIDAAIAGTEGDDDVNRGEEFLRQLLQKEIWNEVTELARLRPSLAEQIQNVLLQLAEALNNVLDKITNPQARKEVETYRDAAIDLAEQLGVVARGEVTKAKTEDAPVPKPANEAAKSNAPPEAAEAPSLEAVPIEIGTVDEAAHEAATSPNNDLPAPTPAQIEASNYKVGPVVISGVKISVENPEGSKRRPEWPALKDHYGRIPGTMAQDGELIDVFIVPGTPTDYTGPVFVVQQIDPKTGENDEVKAIIGAKNAQDARQTYERNYAPDWKGFGGFAWEGEMARFKQFLADHTSDNRISRENAAKEADSTKQEAAPKKSTTAENASKAPVPQPASQTQTVGTPTPNGARAEIVWDVIDAADAASTIEDRIGENQNRQRAGDQASDKQRVQLATNPDVSLLGEFPTGMSGAPMVDDASGKTVAGNGRMGGILLGYSSPDTGFATVYKPFVLSEAEKRGLGDKARGMKQPVLVRRITRYENGSKEDFVAQNNPKGGGILRETKTGEGLADAKSLAAILPELTLTAGGALTTDALYAVAQKLAQDNRPLNEDTQGKPDAKEALQRVQQATLAVMAQRAGRTIDEIVSIMESESGKRVVSQIMRAAPDLSRLDTDLSLVTPIMDALLVYKDGLSAVSNEAYDNLDDWAKNRGAELLSGNQSEESLLLLDLFVRANRKPSILRDWFDAYLLLAGDEQYERNEASQTADIFGDQRREVPAGTLAQRAQASQSAGADEGSAGGDVADQRRVAASADPESELDENTGLPLNPDGTVTVYHGTTKAGGDSIRASGVIKSAGEPDVYFTTEPTASTGYGDGTVVAVDISPDKLVLDDEFPDGRRDFRVPVGKSKSLAVKVRNAPVDPDFSLETQTPDDVQAEREAEEERQRVLAREAQTQRLRKIVEDRIRAAEADRKQGRLDLQPDLPVDLFDYGQRLQRQKFQPPLLSTPPVRRAPADPGNGPSRSRQMFEAWYKAGGGDLNDRITTEKAWRENRMRFVRKASAATVASSIRAAQREDIQDEGPPETEWPVLAKDTAPRLPDGMAKKLGNFWTDISSDPKAFAYPTSNATDIQTLAKVMSGGKVTAKEVENRIELKHRDGGELVIKDINGRPDIGAGAAMSAGKKDGGGKLMYQIALSWAANNGKRINPSYALSPINAFTRRTSAMLSSALRYGTTRHMQVDPDQGVLGWRDWRGDQDTSGNIGRLAYREMTQTLRAYPQLSEFRYDFDLGRFERNGQPSTPADIEAAIKETDTAGFANAAGVGKTTAQRAIITQTAMNEGMVADESMTAPDGTLYTPSDPGDLNDDEADIDALLAALESELPSDAEIERLTGMSLDEHKGWRTVGNPEPAGLGEDEDARRRTDVVRLMYDLQREKESFAQWDEVADKMLAEDRNGVKLRLLEAAEEGAPLGSPEMVRAASKLIPQLMQEAVMTRNPRTMREAKLLTWAYARAGTEAARELAARQDRYKTPTERRAEFMTKLMFDINPKDRQNVEAAITPAEKRRRLRRIQAELDKARADRDIAREKAAEAEKRATQSTKDQAQVLDEATTLRLRKIEAALQKEGITLEDVFDGRAQVRLNFARIAAAALGGGSARKEKAVDLIIHGWPTTEIARATGYTAKQVDDIQKELSVNNGALRAVLAARVKAGFRVTDFVRPAANARKAPGDPGQPELTQAEIDAEVDRIIKLMVPTAKQRNSGKWKPQIRGDKLTGTAAATQADAQKQAEKMGRPGKPPVDGPFVPDPNPATQQDVLIQGGQALTPEQQANINAQRQPAGIIPPGGRPGPQGRLPLPKTGPQPSNADVGPAATRQRNLDIQTGPSAPTGTVDVGPNATRQGQLGVATEGQRQPAGVIPAGPNATKQGKLKLDPDTVEFMPRRRDDPAQDYRIARIISTVDATGLDMLQEYWINGILSGPQTHVVNTLGNFLSGGWEYTGQRGMEILTNLFLRDPASAQVGEIPQLIKGLRRGMGEAWSMAAKAWDAEADVATDTYLNEQAEFTGDSWDKSRRIKAAIGGKTGRVVRMPGRALMAMDSFFKTIFANMEVGAQAYRIGRARGLEGEQLQTFIEEEIKATGSASWIRAMEKAKEVTFQGDINTRDKGGSYADHAANEFMRATNSVRLLKFLFPFVKTPYNIFKTGLRKSPLGAANVLYQLARAGFYKMKDGKPVFDSYPKAAAVKHFSEQTIAFMALASLFGMMEGDEDDDKKAILITGGRGGGRMDSGARDLQKRTQGGPYQIRIAGKWFPYGRLEPIATTLGTMTDAVRAVKSGRDAPQVGAAMFSNLIGQAQDKTFLQGFSRLSDTLMSLSDEDAGEKVLDNARQTLMEMVVPNLIRQPLRNLDDQVRNYKAADVPYAAIPSGEFAEPAIDEYGRELVKDGGLTRLIYPAPLKTEDVHPADKLLERWNQANPDEKYEPLRSNKATYSLTTRNPETGRVTKVQMEPEQKTALDVTRGMLRDEMLRGSGLLTPENIKRPTLEVIDRIKDIREKANRTAGKIIRQPNWREAFAKFRAERQNQPRP